VRHAVSRQKAADLAALAREDADRLAAQGAERIDLAQVPTSSSSGESSSEYDPQSGEDIVDASTQYDANLADDKRTPTARRPDSFFVEDNEHIFSAAEDSVGDVPATSSRRRYYSPVRNVDPNFTSAGDMINDELEGILRNRRLAAERTATKLPAAKPASPRRIASDLRDAYDIRATEKRSDFDAMERKVHGLRERCLAADMDVSCRTPTPIL
jgi:hypothetical protein